MATQKRCVLLRMHAVAAHAETQAHKALHDADLHRSALSRTALAGHPCPDNRARGQGSTAFPLTCAATLTGALVPPRFALYPWLSARLRFPPAAGRRTAGVTRAAGRPRLCLPTPAKYVRPRNSKAVIGLRTSTT